LVLVDASVWVSHLRAGNKELIVLLNSGDAMCHPFIVGELACGNIKNRTTILFLSTSRRPPVSYLHKCPAEFRVAPGCSVSHAQGRRSRFNLPNDGDWYNPVTKRPRS